MKTMIYTQTHSTIDIDPKIRIKKCLFLYKDIIKNYNCDFFVFNEGIYNLPDNVNFFVQGEIKSDKINFDVTGVHEPRRHYTNKCGIPVTPGNYKAYVRAMTIAIKCNYDKVIHVDQDAQFFNNNIIDSFFSLNEGAGCGYTKHYKMKEPAFQVINKDSFKSYRDVFINMLSYTDEYIVSNTFLTEMVIPITKVFDFKGDRYDGSWGFPETFSIDYDYVGQLPLEIYYKKESDQWKKTVITSELDNIWMG